MPLYANVTYVDNKTANSKATKYHKIIRIWHKLLKSYAKPVGVATQVFTLRVLVERPPRSWNSAVGLYLLQFAITEENARPKRLSHLLRRRPRSSPAKCSRSMSKQGLVLQHLTPKLWFPSSNLVNEIPPKSG